VLGRGRYGEAKGGNGAAEPRRAMPAFAGARRLAPRFYEPGPRITTPDGLPWVRLTRERIPTLWVWYEKRINGNSMKVSRDKYKDSWSVFHR
jgi:hypothetical protein